ncbi:CHAT domain-containing protein [Armillaria luteobubalina]|uniref:CHAT domain-containing protein n=1 Tax=Armillaria luteobubalina TaxID=153913 RepID=A0AA39QHZ7_9AGAR|nr:CHAT domain-containing protein [Armillaria luteobubalina]
MDDIIIQELMMIKEAESPCWNLMETIEILMSFASSLMFDKCEGWSQVIGKLDNDDPALELAFRTIAIPSEHSSNPSSDNENSLFVLPTTNSQSEPHLSSNDLIISCALLNNRGVQLLEHFEQFSHEDNLQNAISALDHSVSFTLVSDPGKSDLLSNLCAAFLGHFKLLRGSRNLDQAVKFGNNVVSLADGDGDDQAPIFYNLSNCYAVCSALQGNQDDLNSAILTAELAVSASAEGSPQKPSSLYTLTVRLAQRFEELGELDDIESAIKMGCLAFSLAAEGDQLKSMALDMVAIPSLQARFAEYGNPADLDEAIIRGMDALNAVPGRSPDKPVMLVTLSNCHYSHFELNGDLNDLTEAISLLQNALSHVPDRHVNKPVILYNLCNRLNYRFRSTQDANDLDKAVSAGRRAVACNPDNHSVRATSLGLLTSSLQTCFQVHKHADDLEESITCGRKSLSYIPDDDLSRSVALLHLATSVALRFDHFQNPLDAKEAISLSKSAVHAPADNLSTRLKAARQWARLCRNLDFPSALEAYKVVVNLVPQVAWTRQINEAVEWVIHCDEADTALEWLEMGWAIVWGQLHNLRSPVDFVSDAHPDLTERLSEVAVALEKATSQYVDTEYFKESTMEDIAKEHRRLATEWDSLVERVRALPGFEDPLGPKKLATLKNAAKLGPVVILNTFHMKCDALVLIPGLDNVVRISLEDFSHQKAKILQKRLNKLLSALGVRTQASQPVYSTLDKDVFMNVLKELWTCVMKPVLDSLAFSASPLAFLPIHAAGDYRTNEPGTKLSDYVVSSYTPTLTILLDKLEKTRRFKGLLAISQPNTPGLLCLLGTTGELQKIEKRVNRVHVEYLRGEEAMPDKVLDGMSACNWVHMACHAMQEKAKPLDSTFHLHHSSNYHDESFPDADFAYLSACQTATGDESLSEESVHLAAGMLMARYQSVIVTLWSIRDADAPLIADEVYSQLFKDREPDSGNAAIALHHAIQSLCKCVEDEPDSFVRWVPFIHVGV